MQKKCRNNRLNALDSLTSVEAIYQVLFSGLRLLFTVFRLKNPLGVFLNYLKD